MSQPYGDLERMISIDLLADYFQRFDQGMYEATGFDLRRTPEEYRVEAEEVVDSPEFQAG